MTEQRNPVEPPTGTVTFLFTDVEGSTRLWQEHPTETGAAHASLLLALSLAEEREEVARRLDAAAGARDGWRNRARRGDQWTLSYAGQREGRSSSLFSFEIGVVDSPVATRG